jgi:hypothetical protein
MALLMGGNCAKYHSTARCTNQTSARQAIAEEPHGITPRR